MMTKNTEVLPFPLILTNFFVTLQWYFYGYLLEDYFIQIPNLLGCILSSIQLTLFVIYPNKSDIRYKPLSSIDFQTKKRGYFCKRIYIRESSNVRLNQKLRIYLNFFFLFSDKFVKNFLTAVRARKSFLFLSFR